MEKNQKEVTIHDLDPLALTLLVDFSYTGEIVISEDNVQVSHFWLKVALLTICFIISFWIRFERDWKFFVCCLYLDRYMVLACWVAEMFEFLHFSLRSIENKIKCQQQMYILWVESPLCNQRTRKNMYINDPSYVNIKVYTFRGCHICLDFKVSRYTD